MGAVWGNNIKLSIFGESHGKGIGINIDGFGSGIEIDFDFLEKHMQRRAPGKNKFATARKESDSVEILSGVYENITTGAPLCVFIPNGDTKSKDYSELKRKMRPSHSDYPANIKYRGYNDVRGGGHFSGRLTAPIVFAGTLARQILKSKGIEIYSHIKSIKNIEDVDINNGIDFEKLKNIENLDFPVIDTEKETQMKEAIENARSSGDSLGGVIECVAVGLKAGVGNPFFDSLESTIAHLMFSIPAVKGVEFGAGFDVTQFLGSEANDQYYYDENRKIKTYSNNNGGILGGISNGMPINVKVAIKPTPSIGKGQKTIDIEAQENCELIVNGRHDPCIVPRAVVVVESMVALAILDQLKGENND